MPIESDQDPTMTNLIEKDPAKMPPDLPHVMIINILSRLPVKSLLKFRCVSKSWRYLISEPYLIKKHLHMTTREGNYTNHRVIMNCYRMSFKACSLYSLYNDPSVDAIDLDYPLWTKNFREDWIVGSCNGLLCVRLGKEESFRLGRERDGVRLEEGYGVALWNPSTKQFKKLPDSGIRERVGDYGSQRFIYGFGYDEASDDYKVIAILKILGHAASAETEVKVYSLRNHSWRKIQSFPCGGLPDESVPDNLVSGSLVWPFLCLTGNRTTSVSWKIVALDLASETYQEISPPVICDYNVELTLGNVGGSLGMMARRRGSFADIWVMKEFGMRESWTKLIRITYLGSLPSYRPVNLSNFGVMFVDRSCRLVLYNSKSKILIPSPIKYNFSNLTSCVYIESLVSPNAEQGLQGNTSEC